MEDYIIEKVEGFFKLSRDRYIKKIEGKKWRDFNYDYSKETSEFLVDEPSGLRRLITLFVHWKKKREWEKEIDANVKIGNQNYSNFLNHSFGKQYNFIDGFNHALNIYINSNEDAIRLIQSLDGGIELNDQDFRLAIQLYYIYVYQILEQYLARICMDFKSRIPIVKDPITKAVLKSLSHSTEKKFSMIGTHDGQIRPMYGELVKYGFINHLTTYTSFKHVLIQEKLESKNLIYWTDMSDSKQVNKVTILELVSRFVIGNVQVQNAFIVKFFRLVNQENIEGFITLASLKNSRRIFSKSSSKNKRIIQIKQLIDNCLSY